MARLMVSSLITPSDRDLTPIGNNGNNSRSCNSRSCDGNYRSRVGSRSAVDNTSVAHSSSRLRHYDYKHKCKHEFS